MRLRSLATLALAAVVSVGLVAPGAVAAPPSTPTATTSAGVTFKKSKHKAIEKYVLKLVNKARKEEGLAPLTRTKKVVKVARRWSVAQAERGTLAHNPGYARQIPRGWTLASENVAWTSARGSAKKLAKRIVKLWLGSEGHRRNILHPSFTKTGIGVARSKEHGWYFTQNFSN